MTDTKTSPESTKEPRNRDMPEPIPTMEGPAIYRICVKGALALEWSDRLAGMQITSADAGKTILVGRLNDQASLSGVLATLYELHLPVSSVECLESG
jgi:hypothetical protein